MPCAVWAVEGKHATASFEMALLPENRGQACADNGIRIQQRVERGWTRGELQFCGWLRLDRPTTKVAGRRPPAWNTKNTPTATPVDRAVGRVLDCSPYLLRLLRRLPGSELGRADKRFRVFLCAGNASIDQEALCASRGERRTKLCGNDVLNAISPVYFKVVVPTSAFPLS